ncbi:MAG: hypothetical protein LBG31_04650 [Prevotellaceae bacterium]|jgi:hypothetical protein|nr:hypothetical protein [Prevotellaceae bacterium]
MKKNFFLFAMLASITANAAIKITPLATDYSANKVTFKVEWQNATIPYNNRVWVWVDFCPVTGTTPAASFGIATVSSPTKTGGNGTVTGATARGFFIEYANATNAGTTITATLSNASGKFNWCAYGSDYPPNATVLAAGGYTLRGTKPFTINGSQVEANTFGAGTCITSITDPTGRPDGFASPVLTVSSPASPSRCNAGAVTLSVTAGGGTTTAMTYTWTIGGTSYTSNTNSYTTGSLSASAAYSVKVKNVNNCESNTTNGSITVNFPGTNGQAAHATCGCATGTTNCSGTCRTTRYTYSNGACTGNCDERWQVRTDQCGNVNNQYQRITDNSCQTGCGPNCINCASVCSSYSHAAFIANHPAFNLPCCWCSNTKLAYGVIAPYYFWQNNKWTYNNSGAFAAGSVHSGTTFCKP